MLTRRAKYALIAAVVAAGIAVGSIAISGGAHHRATAPRAQLDALARPASHGQADWQAIEAAASARQNALLPHRTAFHRAFAAYMGLSALLQLHHTLRHRCAIAVSYLYDNLLDLHDAYTGEDWTQLRQAISAEPSLRVCAPRASRRVQYVG